MNRRNFIIGAVTSSVLVIPSTRLIFDLAANTYKLGRFPKFPEDFLRYPWANAYYYQEMRGRDYFLVSISNRDRIIYEDIQGLVRKRVAIAREDLDRAVRETPDGIHSVITSGYEDWPSPMRIINET